MEKPRVSKATSTSISEKVRKHKLVKKLPTELSKKVLDKLSGLTEGQQLMVVTNVLGNKTIMESIRQEHPGAEKKVLHLLDIEVSQFIEKATELPESE